MSAMPERVPDHTTLMLQINGEDRAVVFPTHHTLLEVLRERCGLTGTKHGCELGECGACTILIDGRSSLSCLTLAADMGGRSIETVEGLAGHDRTSDGAQNRARLHPLQAAFADLGAAQCGYCTSGMLLAAKALLAANDNPNEAEIRQALAGNLCRCTGYRAIVEAVVWAAARLRGDSAWRPPPEAFYGSAEPGQQHAPGDADD